MLSISLVGNSWAHRLRVGPKMVALAVVSVALFWVDAWIVLALVLCGVFALSPSVDRALRKGAGLVLSLRLI